MSGSVLSYPYVLRCSKTFSGYNPQKIESQNAKEGSAIDGSFLLLCYHRTQDVFDFLKFATTIGKQAQ